MAVTTAGLNGAATGLRSNTTYISLHTGDPGTTGANEISGGSPAYARKAASWSSVSGGAYTLSAALQFDITANTTVSHFGTWTAQTGGTFQGGEGLRDAANNPLSETFTAQGFYTITSATVQVISS